MARINSTKVHTGKNTRFSYLFVNEPREATDGGKKKYSVSLIIPKSDTVTVEKIKRAIQAAYEEGQAKLKGNGKSVPALKNIHTPLRDGDEDKPDDPAYKNSYFINASSTIKPPVVDANNNTIMDPDEIYSGCYGRAAINFYCYNFNGNKGISAGLIALQKLRDGEPLGGRVNGETEFLDDDEDDDDDDDFLSD